MPSRDDYILVPSPEFNAMVEKEKAHRGITKCQCDCGECAPATCILDATQEDMLCDLCRPECPDYHYTKAFAYTKDIREQAMGFRRKGADK